jgi:NAD-dependent deacetylase
MGESRLSFSDNYQSLINDIVVLLEDSNNILFITGAGISAESGLPTYRGIGGLYKDKLTKDNIPIEEALSGGMMLQNPEVTWAYISEIEKACRGAKYNHAHEIIAKMEQRFERVWVLTQNVDGFHRDAGSDKIVDIHGDIHMVFCPACSYTIPKAKYSELLIPPQCPNCNSIMRPDVVLFGEFLKAEKTRQINAELRKGFDIVFSIGTTSVFPYISRPVIEASMNGTPTVEINPSDTEVTKYVSHKFPYGAVKVLGDIWEQLDEK